MSRIESQNNDFEEPQLRELSPEELNDILEAHRMWLESDGKQGQRADLSETMLARVDLPGVIVGTSGPRPSG